MPGSSPGMTTGSTLAQQPPFTLPQPGHVNVAVEIDPGHAFLRRLVRAALMPSAMPRPGVPDIGKFQAPPLRQLAAALPAKLPRQHGFLAFLVGANDVRTQFANASAITADHLLLGEDGVAEEGVGGAGPVVGHELPIAPHSAASSVRRFRFEPAFLASTGAKNFPV